MKMRNTLPLPAAPDQIFEGVCIERPSTRSRALVVPSLLILAIVLVACWTWRIENPARDPVTGIVISGFSMRPHVIRVLMEPIMGPALEVALQPSLWTFAWLAVVWAFLGIGVLAAFVWMGSRSARRALVMLLGVVAVWTVIVSLGLAVPDRFEAAGRRGMFVDWHLHGGDPEDGRISLSRLAARQRARGVSWAIPTHHSKPTAMPGPLAYGVYGTEWSGMDHPDTQSLHFLALGSQEAVLAAIQQTVDLDAVRAAKAHGALVIVAHYWRTAKRSRVPTFEQLVAAGVDGFEIGNRHREEGTEESNALRELDRKVQIAGLLRWSFSDDHGYPAGSPCVTFLEGIETIGGPADARAIVSSLRRDAPSGARKDIRVVPLMFDQAELGVTPASMLVPPAALIHYLRSLTATERMVWWIYGAIAILWIVRPAYAPRVRDRLSRFAAR